MADSGGVGDATRGGRVARNGRPALPAFPVADGEAVGADAGSAETLVAREWLVANGIGGYSSGTVAGVATRRYHGLLVAALPNPLGRVVMLNALDESFTASELGDFRLEGGLPTWRFRLDGATVEKRVFMPYRQNTVCVLYRVLEAGDAAVTIRVAPMVHMRPHEAPLDSPLHEDYAFAGNGHRYHLTTAGLPALRLRVEGTHSFVREQRRREQILYPLEEARGYPAHGSLWSPGTFVLRIAPGETAALTASAEDADEMDAMTATEAFAFELERRRRLLEAAEGAAADEIGAQLTIAADAFVVKPVGRVRDSVRAAAVGDEVRTVIAGYHWFTDWGRDTMIGLEGLTLSTGRHREAGFILRTFAHYVRDGLIPNLFPDGSDEGLYHTADATLWFFHALDRFLSVTGRWTLMEEVLPVMRRIADAHLRGTRFGIGVDPADGLLRQGAEGYQLTWMDAKVDGWVVTPRRGKAVEINALWYNALCALSGWETKLGDADRARAFADEASRVRAAFNRRFWNASAGHLFDVVDGPDGDDPACRPNQLFAISLPHPVLEDSRWRPVLEVVREQLLTPVGLRSLSPDHPDYKSRYFGDLRTRDGAYHQGTVWGWLIGPWVDAWLTVHPDDRAGARRYLEGVVAHLPEFGVGSIAEIFDAEPPYTPRGCVAQAWSVAEALRCWVKTGEGSG